MRSSPARARCRVSFILLGNNNTHKQRRIVGTFVVAEIEAAISQREGRLLRINTLDNRLLEDQKSSDKGLGHRVHLFTPDPGTCKLIRVKDALDLIDNLGVWLKGYFNGVVDLSIIDPWGRLYINPEGFVWICFSCKIQNPKVGNFQGWQDTIWPWMEYIIKRSFVALDGVKEARIYRRFSWLRIMSLVEVYLNRVVGFCWNTERIKVRSAGKIFFFLQHQAVITRKYGGTCTFCLCICLWTIVLGYCQWLIRGSRFWMGCTLTSARLLMFAMRSPRLPYENLSTARFN